VHRVIAAYGGQRNYLSLFQAGRANEFILSACISRKFFRDAKRALHSAEQLDRDSQRLVRTRPAHYRNDNSRATK
jgi:hypothetical protein